MTTRWGRTSEAGVWPRPKPVWTLAALLLALASGVAIGQYRYARVWSPLQQVDASAYLRSAIASMIGFASTGRYHLLHVVTATGTRLPINEEVARVDRGQDSVLTLSPFGQAAGDKRLLWLDTSVRHAGLYRMLRQWVYANQTPLDLLLPAVWGAVGTFAAGLLIAVPRDLKRTRDRREGRRLRGPQLVTPALFNRRMRRLDRRRRRRNDPRGLAIALEPNQSARLLRRRPVVRLPHSLESSHLLLMGDSGTGKSMIIRQLLSQIQRRGESAVIYDPALEFTPEFYDLARGDVILNPLDARCPYWTPSDEVEHEAEAMTIATSLYPGQENDSPEREFFTRTPRQIFAHLLSFRPSPHELARWMGNDTELDRRLAGTPYAKFIDPKSPHQRNGVLASLNLAANALLLLPAERDATARWSAAAWAKDRRGWVFLTSTPPTRDRIRPLTSLWLDTVVLRLMSGEPEPRPTWFILDKLASLQRLTQLHTAVTENRKSNNPLVLGFQGRSQLESRYGHDAEAMLAQPATKIFLRTNEARAAKWIADTIGHIEIERLVESRATHGILEQSYTLTRQIEPLVMDSEITGFSNLRGLLKIGNFVVRLEIPFVEPVKRVDKFVPRPGCRVSSTVRRRQIRRRSVTRWTWPSSPTGSSGHPHVDDLEAAQRGTGAAVPRRGVSERARQLLHRRRPDSWPLAWSARARMGALR